MMWRKRLTQRGGGLIRGARRPPPHARTSFCTPPDSLPIPIFCHRSRFVDFPDVPVRLSGGTLGGGGGCLGSGLGAQASVTSFPPTLEPWQVLQLFVVGDFWTCSCHARGAPWLAFHPRPGGTLGGGGGCLGSGLGAQASVTSFPPTLEPWQVLQLFVVGDFWTCSCHARGAPSGGKMSISHGCGGLLRALGHEKLPWRVIL